MQIEQIREVNHIFCRPKLHIFSRPADFRATPIDQPLDKITIQPTKQLTNKPPKNRTNERKTLKTQ